MGNADERTKPCHCDRLRKQLMALEVFVNNIGQALYYTVPPNVQDLLQESQDYYRERMQEIQNDPPTESPDKDRLRRGRSRREG